MHPQTEDYRGNVNPLGPRACYDEGKRCAETLFFDYARQHRVKIRVVRIFNTYGPRLHPSDGRVVSNFVMQALQGKDLTIYGDGSQTRAFCYVDDLIDGFIAMMAADDDLTGPINLGNPHEIPVLELAERVVVLAGSRSGIVRRPLPQDDPVQRCPDITRARRLLGWAPRVSLDEGLGRTIAYFRERLGEDRPAPIAGLGRSRGGAEVPQPGAPRADRAPSPPDDLVASSAPRRASQSDARGAGRGMAS